MKPFAIQITEAKMNRALTKLNLGAHPDTIKDLYLRDVIESINSLLTKPLENGWIENPTRGLEFAQPPTLRKYTAPHVKGKVSIRVSEAQVAKTANLIRRQWDADERLSDFQFSYSQIKKLVVHSLVNLLDRLLEKPNECGTTRDLYYHDPRPPSPTLLKQYCVK